VGGPWRRPRLAALDALVAAGMPAHDLSHDMNHVRRVASWCARLAPELGVDVERAAAAGLCHDLVQTAKEGPARATGGVQSALRADALLAAAGFDAEERAAITGAIATCSWSAGKPPEDALGAVLQDADRLDAIGAIGIARNMACAAHIHQRTGNGALFHPSDPRGQDRPLDDRRFAADHAPLKLLRLAATMHTAGARDEAAKRHARLAAYYEDLSEEAELGAIPDGA
jgi:uncharacterized protein